MVEKLRELYQAAEQETAARRRDTTEFELEERRWAFQHLQGQFALSLTREEDVSMIAEFKQSLPSAGEINTTWDASSAATAYASGGAAAMSVLTLEHEFSGSPEHVRQAREASGLPILRKDFISSEYQILESAALGASAVLLIVGGFDDDRRLKHLYDYTDAVGLDSLVEVHDEKEMERALELEPRIVGINNRDLKSEPMGENLETFDNLAGVVPDDILLVGESGYKVTREHKNRLRNGYADAVLMGTQLMQFDDPGASIIDWKSY